MTVALCRPKSTEFVIRILHQFVARSCDCGPFLNMLFVSVAYAKLSMIELSGDCPLVVAYCWPRIVLVHIGVSWLLSQGLYHSVHINSSSKFASVVVF